MIPEAIEGPGPVPSFGTVQARFKAICDICSKKLYATLDSQVSRFRRLPAENCSVFLDGSFSDLTNAKCRASPFGVGSDTPSFWNHQFLFQKHDLLQTTENLHAALDSQLRIERRRRASRRGAAAPPGIRRARDCLDY